MKRTYSDIQKAEALATLDANDGNVKQTAKIVGVSTSTLRGWKDNRGVHPDVAEMRTQKRQDLADRFEDIAHAMLDRAAESSAVIGMSSKDAIMASAIAVDKMRLLRGLPTEIIEVLPSLVSAIQKRGMEPAEVFNAMLRRLIADDSG